MRTTRRSHRKGPKLMVAFVLISMICFVIPVRTCLEWASGPGLILLCSHNCQEILYLMDLYLQLQFPELLVFCLSPHQRRIGVYAVWNASHIFFERKIFSKLLFRRGNYYLCIIWILGMLDTQGQGRISRIRRDMLNQCLFVGLDISCVVHVTTVIAFFR